MAGAGGLKQMGMGAKARLGEWLAAQQGVSDSWERTLHVVVLLGILGLAFYMGMLPKTDYRYPIHVDEWAHYGLAQATVDPGGNYPHPVYGTTSHAPRGGRIIRHRQAGFHTLLGGIQLLSGVSWITLFRYLPPFFLVITAFMAYLWGRREGFGLEAAVLVTLVPTTLRILGPGFLVPMAMGLLLLPVVLLLISRFEFTLRASLLLALCLAFLAFAHPGMAFYLVLIVLVHIAFFALYRRVSFWTRVQLLGLAVLGPLLAWGLVTQVQNVGLGGVAALLTEVDTTPKLPKIYQEVLLSYGIIPLGLFVLGIIRLVWRLEWKSLALASSAILILGLISLYARYSVGNQTLADRGLLLLITLAALVGGYGLGELRWNWWRLVPWVPVDARWVQHAGVGVALSLVAITLALGIPSRMNEPYYRIVDDVRYSDTQWIREYTGDKYRRILAEPTWGLAMAPLAGKYAYTNSNAVFPDLPERVEAALAKLREGPVDTSWFVENDVDIVYQARDRSNPDFIQPRPGIFLLRKSN